MDDKDDIDDEDDDKPSFLSNLSRQPSLARRVGNMTDSTPEVYLSQRQMGPSAVLFSFSFTPSTALSSSRFSSPAGRQASLYEDSVEDLSPPTSLPPPPTVKATSEGQGQPKKEETVRDLEMQIKELQARLEEKKMLEKKEQLPFTANNSVQCQSSENRDSDTTVKVEGLNNIGGQEELEKPSEKVENSSEVVIENNDYAPFKSANKKEVPISTLLKKDSFNKTKFSQEDFLKSILSSPPTSAKGVSEGKDVTGAWTFPLPVKNHGIEISNKDMHQIPKQLADGGSKDFRGAGRFGEEIGMDSSWDTMEEGVFENKFFEADLPQEVVEISLPPNPNIPHTRSKRTEGYIYTDQNSFDFNDVNQTDSKSNSVISENIPGKTLSTTENCPDSNIQSIYSNDSTAYSDLPPLKYPDHSPIGPPSTAGDGQNPLLSNVSNIDSGQSTQLPPKSKSQEQPSSSGDTSAFKSELDENDISGYHEFNDSNKSSYSKFTGNSSTHSVSRYSNYMSSLQSLSDHHGFIIKDVTPDGNCMFSAIIDQLRIQGNFDLTPNSLRKTAVEYLRDNPKNMDGTHLESFLSTETWSEYLNRMGQESQWGDHMVLQACTEVTGQQIVVFKPNANKTVLVPTAEEPLENTSLTLGHIGESHFVSLRPKDWETNWPLMAHAHRAKMKEKQKLARKKVREMKKLKKRKKAPDSTVSNKEDSTAVDGKGKETGNEEGEEIGSEKQKETGSEKEETGSGTEVTESEETTQEAVTSTESDKDEDGSEEEADSDDSQFKTTDDLEQVAVDIYCCDEAFSGIPMPHLSFLIRYLMRPSYLADYPNFTNFRVSLGGISVVTIGSITDGISCVLNDYSKEPKTITAPSLPLCIEIYDGSLVYDEVGRCVSEIDFGLDVQDCHPGYTRLVPCTPRLWEKSRIVWSDEKVPWLKHPRIDTTSSETIVRLASGFRCDGLPDDAMEWVTRERKTAWPSPSLIEAAVQCSCIVVSTAHPDSLLKDVEWQFVFNEAENRLIASLSKPQKYCFRIFKILVDTCTKSLPVRIKTVYLKSVMFYALEVICGSKWADNCGGCIMYLLSKLESHVAQKCLPNYFISSNNMIDHYSNEALNVIADRLRSIRLFPIPAVVFLVESHGINQSNMLMPVIEDISNFTRDKNLDKTIKKAFVPSVILLAKAYLKSNDKMVVELFKKAYKEYQYSEKYHSSRMKTCPSFQDFVSEVLNRETAMTRYALAKALDKHLNMNISASIPESRDVVVVKDIIDPNYSGPVANVPIDRAVLHCTLSQMKLLDDLALPLFISGKFSDAATLLECAIAKTNTARSEMIDISGIKNPDLKADVQRQNSGKARKVDYQYSLMCQHLSQCRMALNYTGHR